MGTTLTGTTPQDTYDSLIKVTDNGPLSGSLKTLTDGLGNDSALALSTGGASITGTLAVSGNATFDTTTLVVDAANNRVGVGTASPSYGLDTRGIAAVFNAGLDGITQPTLYLGHPSYTTTYLNKISTSVSAAAGSQVMQFSVGNGASTYADVMTLNGLGNVGIGTSSPEALLHVNKSTAGGEGGYIYLDNPAASTVSNNVGIKFGTSGGASFASVYTGLIQNIVTDGSTGASALVFGTFNGATSAERVRITSTGVLDLAQGQIKFPATQVASADANTLDDYEEGTWNPTISFGGASVGVTYAGGTTGQYTKVGRQVSVTAYILLSSKGSSTGAARISGLPFTIGNTSGYYSAGSLGALTEITYEGQIQTYGDIGAASYVLNDYSEAGVQGNITNADFSNVSQIIFTATYFV